MTSRAIAAALSLSVVVTSASGCVHARPDENERVDYFQSLRLDRADGPGPRRFDPAALYGHPVLVTFFATWCFPCLGQLPFLDELRKEHAAEGLQVLAVGMDLDGGRVLEPFAAQAGLGYPIVIASEPMIKGETPFGPVKELPTTVLFDRDGNVVTWWPGLAKAEDVRAAVKKAASR